jgi:hypothetical protein
VDYSSVDFGMAVTVGDYEPIQTSANYADGLVTISPTPIPEPETISLLLTVLLGVGLLARKRCTSS